MRKAMEYEEQATETEAEHAEPLKDANVAVENVKLVNTTQERLDNLREITKEETTVSDEEGDDSTSEVKDGSTVKDDSQTESQTESTESTSEAETKDGEINIPDAYMRAAVHHGLDKETVDDMVKTNPESAMKLLESCYLSVNNASREWSELGRAKIEAEREKTTQTATETVEQEDPNTTVLVAKLRKEYPDDPLIDVVIAGLENRPKPVTQPVPQAQQNYETATARANVAGNLAIDQRVNAFFSADVMAPYEKFYGKLELGQIPEDLTNGQQLNRLTVLQEGEFIMAGHNSRGQKIEVEQALEKAHFIVTEPIRKQVIHDSIKATATKRQNSMTFRPSESNRTSDSLNTGSSKPRNRSEVEQITQQKLDHLFKH
ncbi:MAG: hypothetical protein V3V89_04815 [Gammaproteobacteria bacterium]